MRNTLLVVGAKLSRAHRSRLFDAAGKPKNSKPKRGANPPSLPRHAPGLFTVNAGAESYVGYVVLDKEGDDAPGFTPATARFRASALRLEDVSAATDPIFFDGWPRPMRKALDMAQARWGEFSQWALAAHGWDRGLGELFLIAVE